MAPTLKPRFFNRRRLGISLGVIVVFISLFGLLGYFWLPGYAKNQLEISLSETLHRPVSIQSIDIQPYTLEMFVHGLNVGEKSNSADAKETFFSFDTLHIDLSIESIAHRAPVINAITLASPTVRAVREAENKFNFTDLIEEFSKPSEDDEEKALFSVSNIIIKNGHIEFIDRFKQSHQEISEINFGIPFIANFDSVRTFWVEPHFDAKVNGAPFALDGQLLPFAVNREAILALKLTDIDLTNIHEYVPIPVGVNLISGYFDSNLFLTFSQIADGSPKINLTGNSTFRQVEFENHSVTTPYHATLENFHIDWTHVDLTAQSPSNFALTFDNASLSRRNIEGAVLSLAKLAIDNVIVNSSKQHVTLDEIILDGFNAKIRREKNGDLNITHFFSKKPKSSPLPVPGRKPLEEDRALTTVDNKTSEIATKPEPESTDIAVIDEEAATSHDDSSWTTQINRFDINAATLYYTDVTLEKAPPMMVSQLNFFIENIELNGITPLSFTLNAYVNEYGSVKTEGSIAWSPLAIDINLGLNAVDLVSLQGWAGDTLNALLTNGNISFQGNIKADGDPLKISVDGKGQLANINIFDRKNASDLVRWKTLDISDLKYVNDPLRVDINTIKLDGFFAHVILSSEGKLNLTQIIRQDEAVDPATIASETPADDTSNEVTPVYIDKIVLQQGNIDFNDRFIKPNYRANLTGLKGKIGPLQASKVGKIDIKGALDKTAPLEIRGDMDPFNKDLLLDIVAKVKDIDLPPFSSYSGKYVGYAIDKGKLSVDIHYHVENGKLSAKNNVFLDQLTLGERVESEDAISVPLELAIAILKNRRGEIDIHLPIKGSINDPEFSIGGIIFDALVNLITRAITAPFSLLSAMLDSGEELSYIKFTPGFAEIDAKAATSLLTLSEALIDRPALRLEIAGHIDVVSDREGLKLANMQRKIKALKLADEAKKGKSSGSLENVTLTPEEYSEYLERVYSKEDFDKPTNFIGLTKSLPDEEMEQLILENTEITESELTDLAERRAFAAQSWLINQGNVSADRIFVLGMKNGKEGYRKKGNRAEFILK
ncbi:MAG: DUF748 domain-containing protein [Nitrosomonas sp.]|nr:DUF748 domain-containing protein [Nitrosomonas sp.]